MDLLEALKDAASEESRGPDWLRGEEAFHRHFGAPYEALAEVVECLTTDQLDLYRRTLEVNPEAAVLWLLHMEEVE